MSKISVVINTLNEASTLQRVIESVKWADEVLVCDMHSEDGTVEVAKKLGAKVVFHKRLNYVEPARNFAISKASGDWILILDPDEEIPSILAKRLKEMVEKPITTSFIEIPRKNIIFGKWMRASQWWPDYNIRFFMKGTVKWTDEIHRPPRVEGKGLKLPEEEEMAIIHYHYTSVAQFIERLNRYTNVEAKELIKYGYKFKWNDLLKKPLGEFLSRFFANKGYEDGLHGLALSLLQAFSFLVVYLKVWEKGQFTNENITLDDMRKISKEGGKEIDYWFKYVNLSRNPFKKIYQKIKYKIS